MTHAVAPGLLSTVGMFAWYRYNLDFRLTDYFFDSRLHSFWLRDHWFIEGVLHDAGKYPAYIAAAYALVSIARRRWQSIERTWPRDMIFVLLTIGLGTGVVALLKFLTDIHCPWNLIQYAGDRPYYGLVERFSIRGDHTGRCWPGGHASGGYSLVAFYFIWLKEKPRKAYWALGISLLYGSIMGLGRVVQGAHFMSHNFWSAIILWTLALLLAKVLLGYPLRLQQR